MKNKRLFIIDVEPPKIRKDVVVVGKIHRDRTKYRRKQKHKQKVFD